MARLRTLLLGGTLGGLVGGYLAHRAGVGTVRTVLGELAGSSAREREEEDRTGRLRRRERLAAALRAEVETFVTTYMEGLGGQLELLFPGQVPMAARPPQEYYFTIYDSNAAELADIFEPREVDHIVRFYGRAKGLLDAWRGWEDAGAIDSAAAEDRLGAVAWAMDRLRQAHRELHKLMPGAVGVLRAEGGGGDAGEGGPGCAGAPPRPATGGRRVSRADLGEAEEPPSPARCGGSLAVT